MRAQDLAVGPRDRQLLERHGFENGAAYELELCRPATVDAPRHEFIDGFGHASDTRLRQRNRTLCGRIDLFLALAVDQAIEPEIEGEQRGRRQADTENHRDQIFTRDCPHADPVLAPTHTDLVPRNELSHAAVKAALSLR